MHYVSFRAQKQSWDHLLKTINLKSLNCANILFFKAQSFFKIKKAQSLICQALDRPRRLALILYILYFVIFFYRKKSKVIKWLSSTQISGLSYNTSTKQQTLINYQSKKNIVHIHTYICSIYQTVIKWF